MTVFSKQITDWYQLNFRQLPWRETLDPYKIWISEVILQQTRVAQGLPYYLKFIKQFPKVMDLAKANEAEVLKLWQGLGYYSRARNMHHTAKEVVKKHKGIFPSSYEELIKLKGIGDYTASAIASITINEAKAVVDGNVYRVLARVFGIESPMDSTEGKKIFKEKAESLLFRKNAGKYNQAIMEFGATVCTPKKPACNDCIFSKTCVALLTGKIAELPVKSKKTKIRNRYFSYFVIHDGKNVQMKTRIEKDIWHGLVDFPLVETKKKMKKSELADVLKKEMKSFKLNIKNSSAVSCKHVLSHQILAIDFYEFKVEKCKKVKGFDWVCLDRKKIPGMPQVVLRYLEESRLLKK